MNFRNAPQLTSPLWFSIGKESAEAEDEELERMEAHFLQEKDFFETGLFKATPIGLEVEKESSSYHKDEENGPSDEDQEGNSDEEEEDSDEGIDEEEDLHEEERMDSEDRMEVDDSGEEPFSGVFTREFNDNPNSSTEGSEANPLHYVYTPGQEGELLQDPLEVRDDDDDNDDSEDYNEGPADLSMISRRQNFETPPPIPWTPVRTFSSPEASQVVDGYFTRTRLLAQLRERYAALPVVQPDDDDDEDPSEVD